MMRGGGEGLGETEREASDQPSDLLYQNTWTIQDRHNQYIFD